MSEIQTLRPVETRPEEPRAGVWFLGGGSEPSPSARMSGSAVSYPAGSGEFGFWSILGPQKSRWNGQLAFESGEGATRL